MFEIVQALWALAKLSEMLCDTIMEKLSTHFVPQP